MTQVIIKVGKAWRVRESQHINRFRRSKRVGYQGDTIVSKEKATQKSDGGKMSEASKETVNGAEKLPTRSWIGSTVRGSLTEVHTKSKMRAAKTRDAIIKMGAISQLPFSAKSFSRKRFIIGGTAYLKSMNQCIILSVYASTNLV